MDNWIFKLICYGLLNYLLFKLIFHPNWAKIQFFNLKKKRKQFEDWDHFLSISLIEKNSNLLINFEGSEKNFGGICSLVLELKKFQKKFGIDITDGLINLRKNLSQIYELEKKLIEEMMKGLWQKMAVMMLVWMMIFAFYFVVNLNFSFRFLLFLFCWQFLGLGLFIFSLMHFYKKYFDDFFQFSHVQKKLSSLYQYELSYSELVDICGINSITNQNAELSSIYKRWRDALHNYRYHGVSMKPDLMASQIELDYLFDRKIKQFQSKEQVVRFGFLVIFQVLCYFLMLYQVSKVFIFKGLGA